MFIVRSFHDHVRGVWSNGDRCIRHQRPRRRRPHQEGRGRVTLLEGSVVDREANVDRRVDHRFVALGELVVAQSGPAPWAVRRDAVVLHE